MPSAQDEPVPDAARAGGRAGGANGWRRVSDHSARRGPEATERVAHRLAKAGAETRSCFVFAWMGARGREAEKLEETANRADHVLIEVRIVMRPGTYTAARPMTRASTDAETELYKSPLAVADVPVGR